MASDPSRVLPQSLRWLKLPRNAMQAILFHPSALNCPHLPTERLKAKVSQLATISTSCDTRINFNLTSPSFVKAFHIPNEAVNILHSAQSSIADLPQAKQLIKEATANIKSNTASHWNTHLSSLSVQCKLTEAVNLEQESQVWKRIRDGLPAGQLSFILRAASDTLPTTTHPFEPTSLEDSVWCQMFSVWKFLTNSGTYPKWLPSGT